MRIGLLFRRRGDVVQFVVLGGEISNRKEGQDWAEQGGGRGNLQLRLEKIFVGGLASVLCGSRSSIGGQPLNKCLATLPTGIVAIQGRRPLPV